MSGSRTRGLLAIEAIIVLLIWQYGAHLLLACANLAGTALPDMPLLRHTYLTFLMVLLVMIWLHRRGEGLAHFGLVRPRRPLLVLGAGLALTLVLLVSDSVVRSLTTPLIVAWTGANPHLDQQTFAALKGDLPTFLITVPAVWLFAGLGEEFLFRGYLLTRFAELLGQGRLAWGAGIAGQGVLFGLAHWYQGPVGMVPIAIGAMISGVATTAWGRNLWPAIIAHSLIDTLGFTLLYLGKPLS